VPPAARDAAPLIDLHRHLEGSFRPETVAELTVEHGLDGPRDAEAARAAIQVPGQVPTLVDYLRCNDRAVEALADLDACRRVAREAVQDAAAEGLGYVELRFSPGFMARPHGLDAADVTSAVADGVRDGMRETGLEANLIGILSRTFGPDACRRELEALLTEADRIAALDLAGDELRWPGELFEEHFRVGREAGWQITVHAGEAAGAAGVRHAVERLGAQRVGHGVRAIEDASVVELLAEREIPLEVSLTSNVQTSTFARYAEHPLADLMRRGVRATITTDNPTASATTLPRELTEAAPAAGLDDDLVARAVETALESAFMTDAQRDRLGRGR
jgi:adenosine deaminase